MRSPKATIDLCLRCSASKEAAEEDVSWSFRIISTFHTPFYGMLPSNAIPERENGFTLN